HRLRRLRPFSAGDVRAPGGRRHYLLPREPIRRHRGRPGLSAQPEADPGWPAQKHRFKPKQCKLTGMETASPEDIARLHLIMIRHCRETSLFVDNFLSPYKDHWDMDYGSFRPIEEHGRKMRTRARNDLLHVDSFPTRATYGKRILRIFTNVS